MPSKRDARLRRTSKPCKIARPSLSFKVNRHKTPLTARRGKRGRVRQILLTFAAVLLAAGAVVALLIHFEKSIPPLLAEDIPKADSVLVEKVQ